MEHTLANWQVMVAGIIFFITYAIIITEKINRALIALLGAIAMLVLQIVDLHTSFTTHIEWNTLFLLIGMMVLVGIANKSGIFQYIAVKAAQKAQGDPIRIMIILFTLTAFGSALLDNMTTVLLIVPITFTITRMLQINPIPFLITEIIGSNIGGTATLIGDPPNIMIGSANKHLTFNMFLINLLPIVFVLIIIIMGYLLFIYRKQLQVTAQQREQLMKLSAAAYIVDPVLVRKSILVLLFTIVGFIFHAIIHVEAAVIAMLGATILMLIGVKTEAELEEALHQVEWVTVMFFIGLFILVGGLIETGMINRLADMTLGITNGNMTTTSILILWVSGIASATIDNIPFVATMIPLLQNIGSQMGITDPNQLNPLWWSLALGSCLGGNGTLIGATANVIVAGMAQRAGYRLGYIDFLKIGAPITLISLLISTAYVLLFILR